MAVHARADSGLGFIQIIAAGISLAQGYKSYSEADKIKGGFFPGWLQWQHTTSTAAREAGIEAAKAKNQNLLMNAQGVQMGVQSARAELAMAQEVLAKARQREAMMRAGKIVLAGGAGLLVIRILLRRKR